MMKRFFKIFLLVFLFFGGMSCNKILDTTPEDFVSPEDYYNTEDELNRALSGVYRMLATDHIYANYLISVINISDEYFYRPVNAQTGANVLNIGSADYSINEFWRALYQGIQRANLLLESIDKPEMDEDKRNVIKGEALFLRAYFHFLLVDYFGAVPLKLTATKSPNETDVVRSPVGTVYEQIIQDMKEAENLVSSITSHTYNGHVTQTAVQGVLARVYLTMTGGSLNDVSKYADALEYAEKVVNSELHSLNPSYQQIFINHSQDIYDLQENLWEIEFAGDNTGFVRAAGRVGIVNGISSSGITYPGYSAGAYNVLKTHYDNYTVGDLRRDWNVSNVKYVTTSGTTTAVEHPVTTNTIYDRQIGKWRRKYETGTRAQNFNSTNFPILRYADILLMYAEAYYHVNGLEDGKAIEAVNQVRRRAFGVPVNLPIENISVVSNITLSTSGNTGYLTSIPTIPVSFVGGGGSGATGIASVGANGRVSAVRVVDPGNGYTSAPTVIIGTIWTANTTYTVGTQVFHGNNLYTITRGGTSTTAAPIHISGSSDVGTTGAEFTYAGERAIATATVATGSVDIDEETASDFMNWVIIPERARELAFEGIRLHDLKRWGIYVQTMEGLRTEILSAPSSTYHYAANAARNVSQRNVLFPIPNSELAINKLATQNIGW